MNGTIVKMELDFSALVDELHADPGFRARLRAVVLSEELLEAPERIARLEGRVAEMDARLTARLDALTAAVNALTATVEALTAAVDALTARLDAMAARLGNVEDGVASLKGSNFEEQVARHPARYLAGVLYRPKAREVESFDLDVLDPDEVRRLVRVDAVVSGRPAAPRGGPGGGEELLAAVEVSWRVHRDDLDRASDRAALLARVVGGPVLPVALSKLDPGDAIVEAAEELGVELVVDDGEPPRSRGRVLAPTS